MIRAATKSGMTGVLAALAAAVSSLSVADRGFSAGAEPYELVRTLSAIQGDVVRGRADALDVQRRLIIEIAKAFNRTDVELFRQSKKNRQAVVRYVLSGGAPDTLRRLLEEKVYPEDEVSLAKAALAYSEGRKADADELLAAIDHRALPRSLAGHVALVKALVVGASRQSEADALLDDARLLSPGSIVDEASLRRQIELASSLGNRGRVKELTSRYLRRFPVSQYSKGMLRQVANVLGSTKLTGENAEHEEMGRLLRNLPPALNHWVMGEIAEIALGQGNVETTLFALNHRDMASKALGGEKESQRMQLYEGAALVVTDAFERARKLIETTDPRPLRRKDRVLLRAAKRVAEAIREPAASDIMAEQPFDAGSVPQSQDWLEADEAKRLHALAEEASKQVASLVEEASK